MMFISVCIFLNRILNVVWIRYDVWYKYLKTIAYAEFYFSNRAAFHILNFKISSNFQLPVGFRMGLFAIAWTSAGKKIVVKFTKKVF